jgi:hypothetical protein
MTIAGSENSPPECCGAPKEKMEELPGCELAETAEHARLNEKCCANNFNQGGRHDFKRGIMQKNH